MKYNDALKAEALARCREAGVKRTSEEMGISVPTLYKWRHESSGAVSDLGKPDARTEELRQMILGDKALEAKIKQLENQNDALRDENKKLREKIAQMKKTILILMD